MLPPLDPTQEKALGSRLWALATELYERFFLYEGNTGKGNPPLPEAMGKGL